MVQKCIFRFLGPAYFLQRQVAPWLYPLHERRGAALPWWAFCVGDLELRKAQKARTSEFIHWVRLRVIADTWFRGQISVYVELKGHQSKTVT